MAFYGLFIGVDRYRSPDINWLSCARRDAVALEALFADALGGATTLLVDEDATQDRIREAFARLSPAVLRIRSSSASQDMGRKRTSS